MKKLITNYTFDASAKTITLADYTTVLLEQWLVVTNVTDNVMIYNFVDPTLGGTAATNVLTLTYDTASMSDTDDLQIFIDDPTQDLPFNDENRLKVSTLPGMPDACTGVLTTTIADATDVTGTGAVGGTAYLAVDVSRASNVMFSMQNTGGTAMAAGQFAIEASLDSTDGTDGTWIAIQAVRSNANTIVTNTGTLTAAAGAGAGFGFEASVNANMWFRLRVSTNVTDGAEAKWTIIRGSYATEPIPAVQSHAVTMTTTTVGGSASVGGFSQFRNIALSNTDVAVKASSGRVYSWYFKNPDASATAWVHFYNATTANTTVGTTTPVWSVEVPAGGTNEIYLTIPMSLATATTIAATTSADHTVSTAPTTAIVAFVGYI